MLSSIALDILLFLLFCVMLHTPDRLFYIAAATALARLVSSIVRYVLLYGRKLQNKKSAAAFAVKYFGVVIAQAVVAAVLVMGGVWILPMVPPVAIKLMIDFVLFFVRFYVQEKMVFERK